MAVCVVDTLLKLVSDIEAILIIGEILPSCTAQGVQWLNDSLDAVR